MAIIINIDVMLAKKNERNGAFRKSWIDYGESYYCEKWGSKSGCFFNIRSKTLDYQQVDILAYKGDEDSYNRSETHNGMEQSFFSILEGTLRNEDLSADGSKLTDTCVYAKKN